MKAGGEIAANFRKVYYFMNGRLPEADKKMTPQMITNHSYLREISYTQKPAIPFHSQVNLYINSSASFQQFPLNH